MRAWARCGAAELWAKVAHCSFKRKALMWSHSTILVCGVASASLSGEGRGRARLRLRQKS